MSNLSTFDIHHISTRPLRRILHSVMPILLAAGLAACGGTPANDTPANDAPAAAVQEDTTAIRQPDQVALAFFDDLQLALKEVQNPELNSRDLRVRWATVLAEYFAPNERAEQRQNLADMLLTITKDRAEVPAGEVVTFELRFDRGAASLQTNGPRATVVVPNVALFLQVNYPSGATYEKQVPLGELIGNSDGAIPLINISGRWYLTGDRNG